MIASDPSCRRRLRTSKNGSGLSNKTEIMTNSPPPRSSLLTCAKPGPMFPFPGPVGAVSSVMHILRSVAHPVRLGERQPRVEDLEMLLVHEERPAKTRPVGEVFHGRIVGDLALY